MKKIIFLAGVSRSGTTFLDAYLGQYDNTVSIGELRQIMQRSFIWNEYCSCGDLFNSCDFWTQIDEEFRKKYDPNEILKIKSSLESPLGYLRLFSKTMDKQKVNKYREAYHFLIDLIFEKSGADFLIDSSKVAAFAYYIYHDTPYSVVYIHLTREAEGVITSMAKIKKRPEKNPYCDDSPTYMRRMSKWLSFIYWVVRNIESKLLSKYFSETYFIDYKQLKDEEFLKKFAEKIGLTSMSTNKRQMHIISGNPSRFKKDFLNFKYDDTWKRELSPMQQKCIAFLSKPINSFIKQHEENSERRHCDNRY